jgi:hypothetical protein
MSPVREAATFYRAALWLGLKRGEDVVRWADRLLEAGPDAPSALCEVALTPPGDLTALRRALQPLSDERESEAVVDELLELAASDLLAGRRSSRETITLLGQMRSGIALSDELFATLHPFGIQHMLGSVGVQSLLGDAEAQLRDWLLPWAARRQADRAEGGTVGALIARPD